MSKIKQKNILVILLFAVISFFAFGCENKTAVEDIYFKLEGDQEQIVLLVGQTIELDGFVTIQPAYATNKGYSIQSFDNTVISTQSNSITAVKEGSTHIKITSNDNSRKQDIISVSVKGSSATLSAPNNLRYNAQTETISFDAVSNAASYSVSINDQIINIGNTTSFEIKKYTGVQYDRVLKIKVMANAPQYSYVFKNSAYTSEYSVYQASKAKNIKVEGGVLSFIKSENSDALIYLGDSLISTISNGSDINFSLKNLDEQFAGLQKTLRIETKVKHSVKTANGNGVVYNDNVINHSTITILDAPVATIDGSILSWNNVLGASKYEILINKQDGNGFKLATTIDSNYYNLENLPNYNSYEASNTDYEIVVLAVNETDSVNVASTEKQNVVKFNRLETTTISLTQNEVKWTAVENAQLYAVSITSGATTQTFSTTETSLSFANYNAGTYTIEVYAIATSGSVNYLSAKVADKTFTKLAYSNIKIENYKLIIDGLDGEDCIVSFKIDDNNYYSEQHTPVNNAIEIPLNYEFKAGPHVIEVVRLGNTNTTIQSDVHTYDFVQLEAISSINISNAKVSVTRSDNNENAIIKLITTGGTIDGTKETETLSMQFNTVAGENLLGAGDYETKVYVLGDGSKTFSVRKITQVEDDIIIEEKETASLNFKVLAAPTLNFEDSSKAEFTYTSIKDNEEEIAKEYIIYKNGSRDGSKTKSGEDSYTETIDLDSRLLTSETVKYKVQAIGNDADILDSNYSSEITITRIPAPKLTFNNTTNIISLEYPEEFENVQNNSNKYSLTFNTQSSNYEFGTEFKDFVVGSNVFEVVANSVLTEDGVYYLNSNPYRLNLTKLDATTMFNIVDNKLVVNSSISARYELKLTFKFSDSTTATFATNEDVLSCEGYADLPYSVSNINNANGVVYTIDLIGDDYNALIGKFNNGFAVNVQYIQPSTGEDSIINSDVSADSSTLNLVDLSETSTIEINANNQLVIMPANHNQEFGIWLTFNVGAIDYEFKPNGENGLEYSDVTLPYEYKSNVYYINLIDGYFNSIFTELTNPFTVKVKYSYNKAGQVTDLDSVYSEISDELNLVRISNVTSFNVNTNNQLVITASEHSKEYFLKLTFKIGGNSYEFNSNAEQNQLVYSMYELPYNYVNNTYVIELFNSNYEPIFDELTTNFSVDVKYCHLTTSSDVDSNVSDEKNVTILNAVTITRDNQNLKLNNIVSTYTCEHYSVIINDTIKVELASIASKVDNNIIVAFENIYNWVDGEVYSIAALTKNIETNETSLLLSRKGAAINIVKQQTITLITAKDNHAANNSAVVSFETYASTCNLSYVVTISNEDNSISKQYDILANEASKTESFYLDEIDLEGLITVSAVVNANAQNSSGVYVFNSRTSNSLQFAKILSPNNIYVSNSTLQFEEIDNAIGYELWEKFGTEYQCVTGLIETNNYDLSSWVGEKTLVIKTISKVGGFTNSSFSQEFTINKLTDPVVSNSGGNLYITLSSEVISLLEQDIDVTIKMVKNNNDIVEIILDYDNDNNNVVLGNTIQGIIISGSTIVVESDAVITNTSDKIAGEKVNFSYVVTYADDSINYFYCNSNNTEVVVHGLLAPTKLKKTTNNNDDFETLLWLENSNNSIEGAELSLGYVFKVTYDDNNGNVNTYYSNDTNLKYYNTQEELQSYLSVINTTSVTFPAGYDIDNDGDLDVEFGVGIYKIAVKTVPKIDSVEYKLMSSCYCEESVFTVMDKPVLSVDNGVVVWNLMPNATKYIVNIYELNDNTPINTAEVATNSFDLTGINATGLINIKVKAISAREDTLNSDYSAPLSAYRLPQANSAYIEDGNLVLEANKYFTYANITFSSNKGKQTYPYLNPNYETNLKALKEDYENGNWFELLSKLEEMDVPDKYIVDLNAEAMDIISGSDYSISVQLFGNSSSSVGILNSLSVNNLSDLKFNKLSPITTTVNMGVVQFKADPKYVTITGESYLGKDFNYILNNEASDSDFWNSTTIYKIYVGNKEMYAVDYYSFKTNQSMLNASDIIDYSNAKLSNLYAAVKYTNSAGTIIFNVFKDNIINLRDYNAFHYFETQATLSENKSLNFKTNLDATNGYKTINLSQTISLNIEVYMIGGDSKNNVGYVTSKSTNLNGFIRYGNNTLSVSKGLISLIDIRQFEMIDDGNGGLAPSALDNPLYRLIVTGSGRTKIVYLYYATEEEAKTIANANNAELLEFFTQEQLDNIEKIYIPLEFSVDKEKVVTFDFANIFEAGNYQINIRTLAGLGNGNVDAKHFLINSLKVETTYPHYMFRDVEFKINNGLFEIDKAVIIKNGQVDTYAEIYELTITSAGVDYKYILNSNSTYVTEKDDKLFFNIPSILKCSTSGGDKNLIVNNLGEYTIKIKALGNETYINGRYNEQNAVKFTKNPSATSVAIESGKLVWKINSVNLYTGVNIKLEYTHKTTGDKGVYIINNVPGTLKDGVYYYQFIDEAYDNVNSNFLVTSDYKYKISVSILSSGNIINSDYKAVDNTSIERLVAIEESSIVTNNGLLSWNSVDGAKEYLVNFGDYSFVVTSNNCDVVKTILEKGLATKESLVVGLNKNYNVFVTAIGSTSLTSVRVKTDKEFNILEPVSSIRVEGGKIVWDEVSNAIGYNVKFTYTDLSGKSKDVETFESACNSIIPNDIAGSFTVYITAVGGDVASRHYLNSVAVDWTSSSDRPESIKSLTYNSSLFRFEWEVESSFISTDSFEVSYEFVEYVLNKTTKEISNLSKITKTIPLNSNSCYDSENGVYYFNLTAIGEYTNFQVKVVRSGTAPSIGVVYKEGEANNTEKLDIYASGDGGSENPYTIINETQFANINYFASLNKHFDLQDNIKIININEYMVENTFNGKLNGNKYSIYFENDVALLGVDGFGLFKNLNNAEIKDVYLGKSGISLKISNMFDNSIPDLVKLSVLATGAINSKITNVVAYGFEFVLTANKNLTLNKNLSVAGLVVDAQGSTFENCQMVDFKVNTKSSVTIQYATSYIAGIVAYAKDTDIISDATKTNVFKLSVESGSVTYVGGMVAYFESDSTKNAITNAVVDVEAIGVNAYRLGGVVGYANNLQLSSCEATIKITHENATFAFAIGGIVGLAANSDLVNVTTNIEEISLLQINGSVNNQYLGAVVGKLENGSNVSNWTCEGITNKTTSTDGKTLGCCGAIDLTSSVQ